MLGHASVESTQIYTQVSLRAVQAVQAVQASTHPAERETPDAITGYTVHNDNTDDTTCGGNDEQYDPLPDS